MSDSDSTSDIEIAPEAIITSTISEKSKITYEVVYKRFVEWCHDNKFDNITEEIMLAYFLEKSEKQKASTLWSHYSMLRTTIFNKKQIDISKFTNVIPFLKSKSHGYVPKKSKVLRRNDICKFLKEACDEQYLLVKVKRTEIFIFKKYIPVLLLCYQIHIYYRSY